MCPLMDDHLFLRSKKTCTLIGRKLVLFTLLFFQYKNYKSNDTVEILIGIRFLLT